MHCTCMIQACMSVYIYVKFVFNFLSVCEHSCTCMHEQYKSQCSYTHTHTHTHLPVQQSSTLIFGVALLFPRGCQLANGPLFFVFYLNFSFLAMRFCSHADESLQIDPCIIREHILY